MGIAFAKLSERMNWLEVFAQPKLEQGASKFIKFLGRNSLIYYLLHQPVMIGLMLAVLWINGSL